jgi:hypothetical protein
LCPFQNLFWVTQKKCPSKAEQDADIQALLKTVANGVFSACTHMLAQNGQQGLQHPHQGNKNGDVQRRANR